MGPYSLYHILDCTISKRKGIISKFIKFKPNAESIFSPGNEGIIMMALFWAMGLWLLKGTTSKHV